MTKTHTHARPPSGQMAPTGNGQTLAQEDADKRALAIDALIRARIAEMTNPSMGPEAAHQAVATLMKEFKSPG